MDGDRCALVTECGYMMRRLLLRTVGLAGLAFLIAGSASAVGLGTGGSAMEPKSVQIRALEGGESKMPPSECRRMLVGPGVNQPDPFPGYAGFVGWESPIRLKSGELLVGFNAGYWHWSPPTPFMLNLDSLKQFRAMGMPAEIDAPRGGRIMLIRSKDNGATWSRPQTLIDTESDDRHPSFLELPGGTVLCSFFSYGNEINNDCMSWVIRSTDVGKTWSKPVRLKSHLLNEETDGPMVLAKDGSIYACVDGGATPGGLSQAAVLRSVDKGKSWKAISSVKSDHELSETTITELPDGRFVFMARPEGDIAWSDDGCKTWTKPITFGFRMFAPSLFVLKDGTLVCLHGSYTKGGLRLIFSTDGGATWCASGPNYGFLVDDTYGYGKATQLPDGTLFIAHISSGGHTSEGAKTNAVLAIRARIRRDHSGIDLLPARQ